MPTISSAYVSRCVASIPIYGHHSRNSKTSLLWKQKPQLSFLALETSQTYIIS